MQDTDKILLNLCLLIFITNITRSALAPIFPVKIIFVFLFFNYL